MTEQEQTLFNRVTGFGVHEVKAVNGARRDPFQGTEVTVYKDDKEFDFFFPDYADMSDEEMAEVIANNLREELWNSLNVS